MYSVEVTTHQEQPLNQTANTNDNSSMTDENEKSVDVQKKDIQSHSKIFSTTMNIT